MAGQKKCDKIAKRRKSMETEKEEKGAGASYYRAVKEEYPDAGCTLDYNEAWKLLVSVRLAAAVYGCAGQCGRAGTV